MSKYRVTFETVIDVEAKDEDEAIMLADIEWCKGNSVLTPYIEELVDEEATK